MASHVEVPYVRQLELQVNELKRRLNSLLQHHLECSSTPQGLVLSPPPSPDETVGKRGSDLQIEHWKPKPKDKYIISPDTKQWQLDAYKLIASTPKACDWKKKWDECGLDSPQAYERALSIIYGHSQSLTLSSSESQEVREVQVPKDASVFTSSLIARATLFGSTVTQLGRKVAITNRLSAYQEIVFVSLCCVLLYFGVAKDAVYSLLRFVSRSTEKHLDRLLGGAKFVNSFVNRLRRLGWKEHASELIFLWAQGISPYGRYADRLTASMPYFVEHLTCPKYTTDFISGDDSDQLFIPSLIKNIVEETLSLSQIEEALGYTTRTGLELHHSGSARNATAQADFENTQSSKRQCVRRELRLNDDSALQNAGGHRPSAADNLHQTIPHINSASQARRGASIVHQNDEICTNELQVTPSSTSHGHEAVQILPRASAQQQLVPIQDAADHPDSAYVPHFTHSSATVSDEGAALALCQMQLNPMPVSSDESSNFLLSQPTFTNDHNGGQDYFNSNLDVESTFLWNCGVLVQNPTVNPSLGNRADPNVQRPLRGNLDDQSAIWFANASMAPARRDLDTESLQWAAGLTNSARSNMG